MGWTISFFLSLLLSLSLLPTHTHTHTTYTQTYIHFLALSLSLLEGAETFIHCDNVNLSCIWKEIGHSTLYSIVPRKHVMQI